MKFDALNTFLNSTCDLSTVKTFILIDGSAMYTFGDNVVKDYKELADIVVSEFFENIGLIRKDLINLYFNRIETMFSDALSDDTLKYFPHGYLEKLEVFYSHTKTLFIDEKVDGLIKVEGLYRFWYNTCLQRRLDLVKGLMQKINNLKTESVESESIEIDYESAVQKIAWMHELGVLDAVMNKCKKEGSYNTTTAAKAICSFVNDKDIKQDSVRKNLDAIYKQNTGNQKNNPLNNAKTKLFIDNMLRSLKINSNS